MRASDIRIDERDGRWCLSGLVEFGTLDRPPFRLEWILSGGDASWFSVTGDPFLAALLLPAMRLGEDLTIEASVSARVMDNVGMTSDIYAAWVAGARRVTITCDSAPSAQRPDSVGLFFSCGVDSFYSLLKDLETPPAERGTHLILMYGFDIRMGNRPLFDMIAGHAGRVAAETGRSLLTVETNARQFFDPVVGWNFYYGPVLASTALALGGRLRRCTIPSAHAYFELLTTEGSHPMLDPLWSTESLKVVHDGCEATRAEKVNRLAQWPLVLEHLRVCWPDWAQDYNCGRCEKCIRTMIGLHLAGVLNGSATFPRRLDATVIRNIRLITGESSIGFLLELLSSLRTRPEDRHITRALTHVVRKERMRIRLEELLERFPVLRPAVRWARKAVARHPASKARRAPAVVSR